MHSDDDNDAITSFTFSANGSGSRRAPFKAIALYDYTARHVDELSFKEGDINSVTDCSDDPWWYGSVVGKRSGSFPSNYVSA